MSWHLAVKNLSHHKEEGQRDGHKHRVIIFDEEIKDKLNYNRQSAYNDISGILTGTLSDGTAINITFEQDYAGQIILSSVPEPVSFALLALGGFGILKLRRR